MSLASCSECWDNPCTCGNDYKNWSIDKLENQIKILQDILAKKINEHKTSNSDSS